MRLNWNFLGGWECKTKTFQGWVGGMNISLTAQFIASHMIHVCMSSTVSTKNYCRQVSAPCRLRPVYMCVRDTL